MRFLRKYSEMRYQYYKDNVFRLFMKNYRDFKGIEIVFAKSEEEQRERKTFIDSKRNSCITQSRRSNCSSPTSTSSSSQRCLPTPSSCASDWT